MSNKLTEIQTQLTRLSVSPDAAGDIHVFSYQTKTTLILPKQDVPLLINALMRLKDN